MDTWDIYFASVAAIRFHPKNAEYPKTNLSEVDLAQLDYAAAIADEMIRLRNDRATS